MAKSTKSDFQSKEDLQEYIVGLQQVKAQYDSLLAKAKELASTPGKARAEIQRQLKELEKQNDSYSEIIASLKRAQVEYDKLSDKQENLTKSTKKYADALDDLINPSEELLDLQNSILNTQGKQSGEYDIIRKKIEGQTTQLKSIADILGDASDISEHQKNIVLEAAEAYKSQDASIGNLRKELKRGNLTQEGFNDAVISLSNYWDDIVNKIDTTNPKLAALYEILKGMNSEAAAFNMAQAEQSNARIGAIKDVGNVVGSTLGDPAGAISSGTNIAAGAYGGDKSMKAAGIVGLIIGTLGVAKGLTNFYQELNKATYDAAKLIPQLEENINNIRISLGRTTSNSRNFVKELALLDFAGELRQAGAQFDAASKTAFFGGQLTGIKGNTQLLQLAGFSAERIVGAMQNLSAIAGLNNNNDLAKNFAILSQNMGLSEDAAAGIVSSFKLLDNVGAKNATDNLKSFRYDAERAGINVGTASQNLAEAAKDALSYQIRSTDELKRQVMFATKLGLNFKSIAEAGRRSVLDYQGQIEAERELESFIGRRVDLQEYRRLISAGDTPGAIKSVQRMDFLNPMTNDRLKLPQAQEALKNLFGMPLDEIQKIFTKGFVERTPGAPKKELSLQSLNDQYLETFKNAMSSLKVITATIDAEQAILRAPIETGLQGAQVTDVFNVAKRAQVANLETLQTLENAVAIAKDIANPNATEKALLAEREKELSSYIKANPGVSLQAAGIPIYNPTSFAPAGLSNTSFFRREPIKTTSPTNFNEAKFLQDEKLRNSIDELTKKFGNYSDTASKTEIIIRDESGKAIYNKQLKYTEQKKGMVKQNVGRLGFTNSDFVK
jgi:hypothetical protein